jgi:hypothetical protein
VEGERERGKRGSGAYVAAAHLGHERGGDDDGGAEHDEVVLEAQQDGLRCIAGDINGNISSVAGRSGLVQ